jgi:hypothetical protein
LENLELKRKFSVLVMCLKLATSFKDMPTVNPNHYVPEDLEDKKHQKNKEVWVNK